MTKYIVWYELGPERVWVGCFDTIDEAALSVVPVPRGRFSLLEWPVFGGEAAPGDGVKV